MREPIVSQDRERDQTDQWQATSCHTIPNSTWETRQDPRGVYYLDLLSERNRLEQLQITPVFIIPQVHWIFQYTEREERGTFLIMKIETKCIIPSINCSSIQFIFLIFSIWNLQNSCHFASSRAQPICKVPPTSAFSSFSEIKITHWRTRLDSENYTTISLPLRLSQKTPHH